MRHDIKQLTELLEGQQINNFVEIGSRDGHDTHYIAQYWNLKPENCFIIEAHPECFKTIIQTYPQYVTLHAAASDKQGVVKFNAGVFGQEENIGISSLLNRIISPFISKEVEVDGWRMEDIMNHMKVDGFDLIKIDVEGFGLQVLQGFGDKLYKTKAIQIELEIKQVWEGQSYYNDVVDYLGKYSFIVKDEITLDEYQKDVLFINQNI
jgi:FkbM family methyltransferase